MARKYGNYTKYITEKNELLSEFTKYLDSLDTIDNGILLPVIFDIVNWKDIYDDKLTYKQMQFVKKVAKHKLKILKYKTILGYNALS